MIRFAVFVLSLLAQDASERFQPGGAPLSGEVFAGVFTPDDREFYFFRKVGPQNSEDYRIFVSRRSSAGWSAPERVQLGGEFSDLYPALTRDGNRLIFSSYRPVPGDTSAHPSAYVYYADRTARGWSTPRRASVTRLGYYHSQLTVDHSGQLHFKRQTGDYRAPVNMVGTLAAADTSEVWRYWRTHLRKDLFLWGTRPGHDDSYVILEVAPRDTVSGRPAGRSDLWVSFRRNGGWSEARPLVGVNSPETENFPFFSGDGTMLYFVREFREFRRIPVRAALGAAPTGPARSRNERTGTLPKRNPHYSLYRYESLMKSPSLVGDSASYE